MAEVIFGAATSHTPMLSMGANRWPDLASQFDPALPGLDFDERVKNPPAWLPPQLTEEVWAEKHAAAQRAVGLVRDALRDAAPDVVVLIGNDQEELFREYNPMFAIATGPTVHDRPEDWTHMPTALQEAQWGYHGEESVDYPVCQSLSAHLVEVLADDNFDITVCSEQTGDRTLSHAFTFIQRRLMTDTTIPIVPIMINTYYPPNQPSPARCIEFGTSIARGLASWPESSRIAVLTSGGLSHFLVEEDFDRDALKRLADEDFDELAKIPRGKLKEGTSETLNWVTVAKVLSEHGRKMNLIDYVPAYRSLASSGVGLAFATWT